MVTPRPRDKDQNLKLRLVSMRRYAAACGREATEYEDRALAADLVRRTAWRYSLEDAQRRKVDRVLV